MKVKYKCLKFGHSFYFSNLISDLLEIFSWLHPKDIIMSLGLTFLQQMDLQEGSTRTVHYAPQIFSVDNPYL